jgi:hypothetical protein
MDELAGGKMFVIGNCQSNPSVKIAQRFGKPLPSLPRSSPEVFKDIPDRRISSRCVSSRRYPSSHGAGFRKCPASRLAFARTRRWRCLPRGRAKRDECESPRVLILGALGISSGGSCWVPRAQERGVARYEYFDPPPDSRRKTRFEKCPNG